jgi:hypothetical protein
MTPPPTDAGDEDHASTCRARQFVPLLGAPDGKNADSPRSACAAN